MTSEFIVQLNKLRLVPVITIEKEDHAVPLAEALVRGGLPCAEVTFRTAAAAGAIRAMAQAGNVMVGAGTVLVVDQVKEAMDAGAQFIVTPGLHTEVIDYCFEQEIPIAPGVATATDIAWAFDNGLRIVKFFPAQALGGPAGLKALCAAYPMMRYIPTGGISPDNLAAYLRIRQVVACGGSWLASPDLYASGDFNEVERVVREAMQLVKDADASR